MTYAVEALYVPKSIKHRRDGDGYLIDIKAISFGRAMIGCLLLFLSFFLPPIFGLMRVGNPLLIWLLMVIGGIALIFWSRGPTMRISPAGVEVQGRLYRAEDASHFTDYADDGWLFQFMTVLKTGTLGLKYGICSVHMPYALPKVELDKVAIFLTDLLKAQGAQVEADRARKIQQAQEF